MGTNYYAITKGCENDCGHCSEVKKIHLGKSSIGWTFHFKADEDWDRDQALNFWLNRVLDADYIEDEYGDHIERGNLLDLVMRKQSILNKHHSAEYPDRENFDCGHRSFGFTTYEFS